MTFSLFKFRFFWLYLIISGQIYGYNNNDNNIRCRLSVVKHNPLRNRTTIGSLTVLLRSRQPNIVLFATMPAAGFLTLAVTKPAVGFLTLRSAASFLMLSATKPAAGCLTLLLLNRQLAFQYALLRNRLLAF